MAETETPRPATAPAVNRPRNNDQPGSSIGSEYTPSAAKDQDGWLDWPADTSGLFGDNPQPAKGLIGVRLVMPSRCPRCHGTPAVMGAGKAMRAAALICICGRHLGWMSSDTFNFISDLVRRFGRPTETIVVRTPRDGGESEAVHQPKPNGD